MQKSNQNRILKGFTLVELLVTITILAILASASVIGYTSFIKKAAISNDTTLTNQINTLLNGYRVDDKVSTDEEIAAVLQNAFEMKSVEVKSQSYNMDIYYNHSNGNFELLDMNDSIYNLEYYLSYEFADENPEIKEDVEIIPPEDTEKEDIISKTFTINSEYCGPSNSKTYSKICSDTLLCKDILNVEYELSVGIYFNIEEGENVTSVSVEIMDLINTITPDLDLSYSLNQLSIVNYQNYNTKLPTESKDSITFYNPGTYELTINYGGYEETIAVNVYNTYIKYNPELSDYSNLKSPHYLTDLITLQIPILYYFLISDYYYQTDQLFNPTIANDCDVDFNDNHGVITDSNRLIIKINNELTTIESSENMKRCVYFEDWNPENDTFTITYYYQGMNGAWVELTQTLKTTIKGDTIEIKIVN